MKTRYVYNKLFGKIIFSLAFIVLLMPGCDENFLEENPRDELSEQTFWKSEKDAMRALAGCYELAGNCHNDFTGWNAGITYDSQWTDVARHKQPADWAIGLLYEPTTWRLNQRWDFNYSKISSCNDFLDNIDRVDMASDEKAEMIAEVRYIRAYSYWLLYYVYGGVPLVTETLTFDEANNVSRASKEEVVNFVLNELNKAIPDLPVTRPSAEKGRIEKGAALAMKGRVLMDKEQWSEAAETYKTIIGLDRYEIDPRFKKLFEDEGDNSDEIIWAFQHIEDIQGEGATQQMLLSGWYGGWNEMNIFQNFVDKFLMTDGQLIDESSLYDPDHPFENRDPRLYATVMLPGYTEFKGKIFQGHPDSLAKIGYRYAGQTGYGLHKFQDEDYQGDVWNYGGDFIVIRYAEVLLSYLECKLEAGDNISQTLLDNTINKVRGRESVDMPPVTETETDELRKILRRERCIELAFEGIRYWDLLRWRTIDEEVNGKFYGMKMTDDPGSYTGSYIINEEGYLFSCEKSWDFEAHDYKWPIPQSELDINDNLKQNPGY